MLGKRKIEVRIVKDDSAPTTNDILTTQSPAELVATATTIGKRLVVGTVIVIAATVVLTAAAEIAVHKLK